MRRFARPVEEEQMRAVLFEAPATVRIGEVPDPVPGEGEVLVRCTHIGVCGSNMAPYLGEGRWARTKWPASPGWMGHENVGVVVESRCPEWPVGTPVVAQAHDNNGFAELLVSGPDAMARIPPDAEDPGRFVIAQPLATVLRALARTEPVAGERCAVVGQGPIGLIFTFLLRRLGAARVIGIDRVPWRLEWAERFGATDVVDASSVDVPQAVAAVTGGAGVDLSVDAGSSAEALATAALLPRYEGRLYAFGVPHDDVQLFPWFHTLHNETRVLTCHGPRLRSYLQPAVEMVAGDCAPLGDLVTPRLPLAQAAEAFARYAHPEDAPGTVKLVLELDT